MSLPVSRNRDYSAETPVSSADLNDFQDKIIAAWAGKHGDKVLQLSALAGLPSFPDGVDDSLVRGLVGWESSTGAVGADTVYVFLPIPLLLGDRIKSVKGFVYTPSASTDVELWKVELTTGALTQVGSTANAAAMAADYQTLEIGPLTETVAAEFAYLLRWNPAAGAEKFLGAEVTFDHP
jgi:hypothetical protein